VKARVEMVHTAMPGADVLLLTESRKLWKDLRDVTPLADQTNKEIWRIVLPPSEAPTFLAALPFTHDYYLDWAGSLIWLACEAGNNPRKFLSSGIATLFRGSQTSHASVEVFHPQAPALASLSIRVKAAFDPKGLFNPGKMYKGF